MPIPVPRSFNQVLSDQLDAFMSRLGLTFVKPGSPILSILEASAQSDVRATQDIFSYVNSISLDRATGDALDKIGADEDLPRFGSTFSTGLVTITDSSFTQISSRIYVGAPAPIVGSLAITVVDGSTFPLSGSVFLGRGTNNYEGPIAFNRVGNVLTLTAATQKFHNLNEPVVLSQGGDRLISSGTLVKTAQGNANQAVEFTTLYSVTIPAGEVSVSNVNVVAKTAGTLGNISSGAIVSFGSVPFTGATVTNPLPFSNAKAVENDTDYKERIRNARRSRSKGTSLAITSGVLGALAVDENKTILSASIVRRQGYPSILYIDDGTGYEEVTEGTAIESLAVSASGGEQYFEVNDRPVAKAFLESSITEPFILESGCVLAIKVNGITYSHSFSVDDFRDIANATAYEVVASINADSAVPFNARLSDGGAKISIIADSDTEENLELGTPATGSVDANTWLGLPAGKVDSVLLYKNDQLLSKDGRTAILTSQSQSLWAGSMTSPATLELAIDNTPTATYTFEDQDFIDNLTGFATLASGNSVASWVTVINAKIPGVTAVASGSAISIVSNLGTTSRSRLTISGGTLVSDGFFAVDDSVGLSNDFELDRNLGQIRLTTSLAAGDVLSVGTANTRAFVESSSIPTTTIAADAISYWVVDGDAQLVTATISGGGPVTIENATHPSGGDAWGDRVRFNGTIVFSGVQAGDWAVFIDPALAAANQGAWRVAEVDAGGTWFEIERPTAPAWTAESVVLGINGLVFVRTTQPIQKVTIPALPNYTAASFATSINSQLRGATAYVNRTTLLRVRTNSFGSDGSIALVAQDVESAKMMMSTGDAISNVASHMASVEASSSEAGTPEFSNATISTVTSNTIFDRTSLFPVLTYGHILAWTRPNSDVDNKVTINYSGKTAGWVAAGAETVTGLTSGASGTLTALSVYPAGGVLGGPSVAGGVDGSIALTAVTGVFIAGEGLSGSTSGANIATVVDTAVPAKGRWSNYNQHTPIQALSGTTITTKNALERLPGEKFYAASPYAIGPQDDLTVVIDEDQQQQRYAMNMYRKTKPTTSTYSTVNFLSDSDNSNLSLALGFGTSYDWVDCAAWMHSRCKTHNEPSFTPVDDSTKTILYRYYRFGSEGDQARLRYVYPTVASSAISVTTDTLTDGYVNVGVTIPSGPAKTGVTVSNATKIGTITAAGPGVLNTITYILGFAITSATTAKRLRYKPAVAGGTLVPGNVLTGAVSLATATVINVQNNLTVDRGYVELSAGNGLAFIDGELINSSGLQTVTCDGTQYGLVSALLDVGIPGATDHGFTSHVIHVGNATAFIVGDVVQGMTSNATAIVTATSVPLGTLTVKELFGTFIEGAPGENISSTSGGVTTQVLTVDKPTNVLYMKSTSGSYTSGLKNIVGRTADTVQYIEGAEPASDLTPGTISWDTAEATLVGSTVIVGDLSNINTLSSLTSTNGTTEKTVRVSALGAQYWQGPAEGITGASTVTSWGALNNSSYLSFFPVAAASTATNYAAAINLLPNCPVTAVAVGVGGVATGTIIQASFDEFNTVADKHYSLTDGINWIKSHTTPALPANHFQFTFKQAITPALATNSSWGTEEVRLAPATTKNVVDYLNSQAVSGLSTAAEATESSDGNKPQISSLFGGREGSVQVQGGSANGLSAAIVGASSVVATYYMVSTVKNSDSVGLSGGQWVGIQNFVPMPKQVFTATTQVSSITAAGVVTLAVTDAWNYANTAATHLDGGIWQIEKQGDFVSYRQISGSALLGIKEGDWVVITAPVAGTTLVAPSVNGRNQGQFRVVKVDTTITSRAFWIENPNHIEERAMVNLHFLTYDSIMPGDKMIIGSSVLGVANVGEWTVSSIHPTNTKIFYLDVASTTPTAVSGVTLGTSAPQIQIIEGAASRIISKIHTISPNANSAYTDIKTVTQASARPVSESAGSVLQSLDKLDFSTSLVKGTDGYRYSTGLIREANKIAYGDPTDTSTYPGIVAAGAKVNIEGPLVKRIVCSLALRLKTGINEKDVKVTVRSAVASVINASEVGEAISISSLIEAAGSVYGVVAITWLSPLYGNGSDLISVQPFEKALVLNLETDIQVSLVGE